MISCRGMVLVDMKIPAEFNEMSRIYSLTLLKDSDSAAMKSKLLSRTASTSTWFCIIPSHHHGQQQLRRLVSKLMALLLAPLLNVVVDVNDFDSFDWI